VSEPLTVRDALRHLRLVAIERERRVCSTKTTRSVRVLEDALYGAEQTLLPGGGYDYIAECESDDLRRGDGILGARAVEGRDR
jgi:hypothetical protein